MERPRTAEIKERSASAGRVKRARRKRPAWIHKGARWNRRRECWTFGEYWFDQADADSAVDFFPTYLIFTKGEWARRPFVLEDWEANDIVRPLFGWKRADGTRRYRSCYVWVARKNGKTELAAGIALLMLTFDREEGGEVYAIAATGDQAKISFERAKYMVQRGRWLARDLTAFTGSIFCPALDAKFEPLTGRAQGKHGLSMSGLVGDEIHEWPDGDLYKYVHDSADGRRQPLELMISTAGKRGGYGEQIFDECVAIRDGVIDQPDTLVVIYAAGQDDDWTKEATWRKANPALGTAKNIDAMRAACRKAQLLPRLQNDFLCYQLNIWSEQAVKWLPMDAITPDGERYGWNHCEGPARWKDLEAKLRGLICFTGIDLSSTNDLSAVVHYFPKQPGLDWPVALPRFYKPSALIAEHTKNDKLPYDQWLKIGALRETEGNIIDYDVIRQHVNDDAELFDIKGVGIDRYNAVQVTLQMQADGLPIEYFQQGYLSMSPPAKQVERLILSNGFHHGGHPLFAAHARAVAITSDPAGNIKPVKDKSTGRIDGIVSLVEAIGIFENYKVENKLTSDEIIGRGGLL